ncbi:MAG: DoxX family protein [Ignavibacteria bacterium]
MKSIISLVGRIFVSLIFLVAGLEKITNFQGTKEYMAMYGMPFRRAFLILAIIVEILGSLSIILGFKAKWGALALFIFLIPTTLIFHTHFSEPLQVIMFWKNLAIMGGLLFISVYGAGTISIDGRKTLNEDSK